MITICYNKVYMTINTHVKIGVMSGTWIRKITTETNKHSTSVGEDVSIKTTPTALTSTTCRPVRAGLQEVPEITHRKLPPILAMHHTVRWLLIPGWWRALHNNQLPATGWKPPPRGLVRHWPSIGRRSSAFGQKVTKIPRRMHRPKLSPHQGIHALSTTKASSKQQPTVNLQRKTTGMPLITSVVFLISWVPHWAYVSLLIADQPSQTVISPDVLLGRGS